jgi:diguanylate cyclase (GGDEF)-like protein
MRHELALTGRWAGEAWARRKDGNVFLVRQTVTAISGGTEEPVRYVSVFNDITERWHADERMRYLASHDALTGLPNRSFLVARLMQLLATAERESRRVAVMFIDLDGFKRVNDLHGHPVGDKVLKEVARRLQQQIRTSDTVARVGGDEFVVLLDNPASPDEVTHIAERIVGIVGDLREVSGHPVSLGASIGIAIHGVHGLGPEDLLSNADAAMYAVKAAGKAGWRFHRPEAAPDAVCAGGRLSDPRAP